MVRGVTEIEGGGQDALVKEVERMLFTEADGAQELVRPSRHRLTGRAGIGLGHGDIRGGPATLLHLPGGAIEKIARALDIAQQVGAGMLDGLKRPERPAELLARLGMLDAELEDMLSAADHLGGPRQGPCLERGAEQVPSLTCRAEEIIGARLHRIEAQLARPVPGDRSHWDDGDSGPLRLEKDEIGARRAPREADETVRDVRLVT